MKLSLTKKMVILLVCIGLIIGTVSIAVYNKVMYDVIIENYERYSVDITKLVAVEIDTARLSNVKNAVLEVYENTANKVMSDKVGTPEFDEYISKFESIAETEDYKLIHTQLQKMQDELDVDCLYITWLDPDNECYVYLIDAAHEDPCPVGCIDPIFMEDVAGVISNPDGGLPSNITKTPQYGWLMATAMPIYDSNGEIIALSAVDISMNDAMDQLVHFMKQIEIAAAAVVILLCIMSIFFINKVVVKPVKELSNAALNYEGSRSTFRDLNIKRKDEIGLLADSMVKMEKDIDNYISDLISAREHADVMDREANTDALTKAKNKRAYDIKSRLMSKANHEYGVVLLDINGLKSINDNYGHKNGDICIKTVCSIIYQVFDRSAVYRIGGDEFVIILEDDAYANRDSLLQNLSELFNENENDKSLPPWKRVSAAFGFAVYNPEKDRSVSDVVQRADSLMYKNKKETKGE